MKYTKHEQNSNLLRSVWNRNVKREKTNKRKKEKERSPKRPPKRVQETKEPTQSVGSVEASRGSRSRIFMIRSNTLHGAPNYGHEDTLISVLISEKKWFASEPSNRAVQLCVFYLKKMF